MTVRAGRNRTRAAWLELLLLPLLGACETPAAPVLVDGAERFEPPPVYQLWWDMVAACSGQRARLGGVKWYVVRGASTVELHGDRYAGYWSEPGNAIVLAEAAMTDGSLVRHEMVHSLIGQAGHSRAHFLERCGGLVVCDQRCVADAGALPPLDASMTRVGADVLEVDIEVMPVIPSVALFGGYFTVTVTAHNPWPNAIAVRLPPSTDAGASVSFEYEFAHGGISQFNDRALDDGVTRFAPGETKRRVYDFHIVSPGESAANGGLQAGTYEFRGAYGGHWASRTATVILGGP